MKKEVVKPQLIDKKINVKIDNVVK